MPYKEKPIEKRYFDTGEVAEQLSVSQSAIRFWLKSFDIDIRRDTNGNRMFTPDDLALLHKIVDLLRVDHYTLEGVRKRLGRELYKHAHGRYPVVYNNTEEEERLQSGIV
jgi:DNA-binding transcriptional MerR regulator